MRKALAAVACAAVVAGGLAGCTSTGTGNDRVSGAVAQIVAEAGTSTATTLAFTLPGSEGGLDDVHLVVVDGDHVEVHGVTGGGKAEKRSEPSGFERPAGAVFDANSLDVARLVADATALSTRCPGKDVLVTADALPGGALSVRMMCGRGERTTTVDGVAVGLLPTSGDVAGGLSVLRDLGTRFGGNRLVQATLAPTSATWVARTDDGATSITGKPCAAVKVSIGATTREDAVGAAIVDATCQPAGASAGIEASTFDPKVGAKVASTPGAFSGQTGLRAVAMGDRLVWAIGPEASPTMFDADGTPAK